jgi:hypothetical protein
MVTKRAFQVVYKLLIAGKTPDEVVGLNRSTLHGTSEVLDSGTQSVFIDLSGNFTENLTQ